MDQKEFNQMFIEAMKDETVRLEIENICQNTRKHRDSKAVRTFRRDMAVWSENAATHDVSRTTIQNGLYAAIRLKTGISSVNRLSDESLPKAKAVFETFKKDFG